MIQITWAKIVEKDVSGTAKLSTKQIYLNINHPSLQGFHIFEVILHEVIHILLSIFSPNIAIHNRLQWMFDLLSCDLMNGLNGKKTSYAQRSFKLIPESFIKTKIKLESI